ncbi:NUDIX hydrolase [Geoalkalibacter sp.]|uniref:NUDIX hydrolase n=1 Tax=Geoalkalibacter sp. TaxID=3041440 RepID=UPI00272E6370|nr:CoA pyrophosphatase [Geoalkalibacter sp.]
MSQLGFVVNPATCVYTMHSFDDIRRQLAQRPARILEEPGPARSAVALILGQRAEGLGILFIKRAPRPGDPWSGDLAFPGGRLEPCDSGPQAAAERETWEELGLDLQQALNLGRLDDIAGAHLPVVVSGFVYGIGLPVGLTLSEEVEQAFWTPLTTLRDPRRHGPAVVHFNGSALTRPAIDLLGPGHKVLWGITYRLVMGFFERLGWSVDPRPSAYPDGKD